MAIIQSKFAELLPTQYINKKFVKTQIVLHHTVGSGNPFNTVHGWNTTKERVATQYIIAGIEDKTRSYKDGNIYRTYPNDNFAWHINCKDVPNPELLEQASIGIELCNYGMLQKFNDTFAAVISKEAKVAIPTSQVIELDFRGGKYFHLYTDSQIENLYLQLLELCKEHKIPKKHNDLFLLNGDAMKGKAGIWGHCNYRKDKSDVAPQPKLIYMLQNL